MPRWEVQTYCACGGWQNTWYEDDLPQTYATEAEAYADIDEYMDTVASCYPGVGAIVLENIREGFRVEEVKP